MKRYAIVIAVITLAAFSITALPQRDKEAETLFHRGVHLEEVRGELKEAIAVYEEIVKKYPENLPVAAKALFHMGLCYEKLGQQEARNAYQRLIADYPGQKEEVALARERLALLTAGLKKKTPQPNFRKIRIPFELGEWSGGQLSTDGKSFAFGHDNRIWVVPVQGKAEPDLAGEPVMVQGTEDAWAYGMSWSADGRWIAFNGESNNTEFIYVTPASGGISKKIPVEKNRVGGVATAYRLGLSPDGKAVAFTSGSKESKRDWTWLNNQIFVAAVDGGELKQLTRDGGGQPCYSPDGSRIAYVTPPVNQENNIPKNDVWMIPAAGGNPVKISDLPGQASSPIWSPDGKMIAFTRNEEWTSLKKEICIVPASEEGKPAAPPLRIKIPFETQGTYDPLLGWTTDNKIGILLNNPELAAVYTVPATGGMALQVTPSGWASDPQWSPGGKRIYFRWDGGQLGFVPSEGGKLSLHPGIPGGVRSDFFISYPGGGNSVSPDGRTVVFSGASKTDEKGKLSHTVNIYTIPVEGGEPKMISNMERHRQARYPCWSPDGKWIAYLAGKAKEGEKYYHTIFRVPAEGGATSEITGESDNVQWAYIDWSPDGKSIAYFSTGGTLNVIPVDGGEPRVICGVQDIDDQSDLSWSPDGQKIVFVSKGKIWVVSANGGEPVVVKTDVNARASKLDWSPDGQKIAFTGSSGGEKELWLVEDFLQPAAESGQELSIRLVWQGAGMDTTGEISPDGKYLSCADWTTSDLAVRDMATGKLRRLTSKEGSAPGSYEAPDHSIWSPDSREIAYTWYGSEPFLCELRLIGLDGSKPRTLYKGDYFEDWVYPGEWSPDGRYILTRFFRTTAAVGVPTTEVTWAVVQMRRRLKPSIETGLISVKDGSIHYLEALRDVEAGLTRFSPDGRYILYDHPQKINPERNDISVYELEAKTTIPIVEHPADDRLLGWAPDGKSILFLSDRTGTRDAWMVKVVDGKPQGAPRLIKRELGHVESMGLTKGGSLYYSTPGFKADIFSASIDPDSGRLLEGPKKMTLPYEGNNTDPRLSPDGKHLAYISQREPGTRNDLLGVFSFESGEVREIRPKGNLRGFAMRDWMPDGRSVLITGIDVSAGRGFYKLDLQTGETTLLLRESDFLPQDKNGFPMRSNFRNISRDGKSCFYTYQGLDKICRVITRALGSQDEKEICRFPIYNPTDLNALRISPDGLKLALLLREEENFRSIKVFPTSGGDIREVHRFEQAGRWTLDMAWSPDGRYIYFPKVVDPKQDFPPYVLWRVPVAGGDAQNLGVTANRILALNVHPDGKQIIFQSRTAGEQVGAVWVMENFLPADKAAK